jgi:endonuclease/exonuclease/phosphatase family metal-dependent hydrolase
MRRREYAELIKHLDKINSDSALLLCGDFNFFGHDQRKKFLKARYASFTGTKSQPTWRFKNRILPISANLDYLFWTEKNLHVDAQLLPFNTSDHRPISAKLL